MRICMISSELPPGSGGVAYYVYNLSKKLAERKHDVDVITLKRNSGQLTLEFIDGIRVRRVPYYRFYPFHVSLLKLLVNKLFKSLESEFDIVHIHSPMPLPVRTSLPIITTVHTPMRIDAIHHEIIDLKSLLEKMQSTIVYPPVEQELFRISRRITAVSRTVSSELGEYGLDSTKITVVGNGVDSQSFFPCRQQNNNEEYVLYTGGLKARKGLFDLIQCASYVSKIRSRTMFIICGRGPYRKKIEHAVTKMGLEKRVIFPGYVSRNDLIHLYQNATVHVVPSHYEGMPTVLLEAMSCGLPVVATDIGGNNEVVKSGVNGFLVPSKRPEVMAEAVVKLLDDVSLRENMGTLARNTILMHYTWDKVADKILECYERMI
jgi:glycosyltransferase involved in cell wall biosynthesis